MNATVNVSAATNATTVKAKRSTRYEIQLKMGAADENVWRPVGVVDATSARAAIREWYDENDTDTPTPATIRAIPQAYITQVVVEFKTHRQLTLT